MMVLMYAGNNWWKRKTKAICIMRLLTEMISINRIVLTCVAVSSIYTPVFASPVLHVSRTNVDLGEVYAHAKQRVKFEFKNSGDKLLTLEEATSGCVECVTVDFPHAILPVIPYTFIVLPFDILDNNMFLFH